MNESYFRQSSNKETLIKDSLTGAYSRELLHEQLPIEIERSNRYGMALSICVIDIDYFKSINDAYGHSRGDQVLKTFTQLLQAITRKSDILFRYGGDEFVLMMSNTNKEQALICTQKILQRINATVFPGDPALTISLSIGVASFPDDAATAEGLFNVADRHCYEAKRRGRGQVVGEAPFIEKEFQFDNISQLIERDEAQKKLQSFFCALKNKNCGILNIKGVSGVGRTAFLGKAASYAEMCNFDIIHLCTSRELKTKAYGAFSEDIKRRLLSSRVGDEQIKKIIEKDLKEKNKFGLIIILDNLPDIDHATINLIRQLLIQKQSFCFGVVYSSDKKDIDSFSKINNALLETIVLEPLSLKGTGIWLRSLLSWDAPGSFLDWIYKQTGGLPKLLKEGLLYLYNNGFLKRDSIKNWILNPQYSNILLNKHPEKHSQISPNNLPAALTEFIARDNEIKEIDSLLDKKRLVTLTGPGGIGKTRLALQVASLRLNDFDDGVFIVSLASINHPDLVISSIAKTLNLKESQGQSIFESLKNTLKEKHLLLILDNFEQVIEASPLITEILTSAPLLTVLVTSREALSVSGECVFNVPPLDTSEPEQNDTLQSIVQNPSIALFAIRAQTVRHDFVITETNAPVISELCARLEGIPLAIELAAANINNISLNEMLEESRNRLKWLSNGLRDLPSRHQTLRNTIEWSFSLLKEDEQKLFYRLGVFSGGFDKTAVRTIIYNNDATMLDVQKALTSLVNKSLLKIAPRKNFNDEIFYEILETIREYAVERLLASGEAGKLQEEHAKYYLSLTLMAEPNLNGPEQKLWFDYLELAYPNISSALNWTKQTGSTNMEVCLTGALGAFWEVRGNWSEGRFFLEEVLEKYRYKTESKDFIKVYYWTAQLVQLQGDFEKAQAILDAGLNLCRKTADLLCEAHFLHKLGWVISLMGDLVNAEELLNKSLDIFEKFQDISGIAAVLIDLSLLTYYRGNYELSESYCARSLALSRESGNKRGISAALNRLGHISRTKGDYGQASKLFGEHLKTCEELEDRSGIVYSLLSLAELARSQKYYDQATDYYIKNLNLCRELGYKGLIGRSLKDLGELARYQGDFQKAGELYSEALLILSEVGEKGEIAWVYRNMAELEFQQGNFKKSKELFIKSLNAHRESNHKHYMLLFFNFEGLAGVAGVQGHITRSARLFGASHTLYEIAGKLIAKDDILEYERRIAITKSKIDETIFNSLWNEGRSMSTEQATNFALNEI